jgi:hypothetical protein
MKELLVLAALAADVHMTPAQQALFESDHLKNVTEAVKLDYDFSRRGKADYEDHVVADIRTVHEDGGKDVWITFLSGERQMQTTPAINFHGNPLLMYFLEHDVNEMRQDTGQPAALFRNRIRHAFVDAAEVKPVTITYSGKTLPATDIRITPFRSADLPDFAGKTYDFVLCDQVPGTLYQIRTQAGAVVESMTFKGTAP